MFLNQSFELKSGNLSYTCVRIKVSDLSQFEKDFVHASQQAPKLFRNAAFIIEFLFEEFVSAIKLKRIRKTIESVGASLVGIKSESEVQITESRKANIAIIHDNKSTVGSTQTKKTAKSLSSPRGLLVQGKVRSGTQIYAKEKDLVICGDVSHGSEIIASGNVFIYGTLFGKAIAGAEGDTQAEIFCYQLSPELISIGGIYIVSEDIGPEYLNKSVRARMLDEKITLSSFAMTQNSKQYI